MKRYKHIFFDLDQTLWDFDRCSAETLSELFYNYKLENDSNFSCDTLISKFHEVNNALWGKFSAGKITKQELRDSRFKIVFDELKYLRADLIEVFAENYLLNCPKKGHLISYAKEVLDYLSPKYELHIITNGFEEVQQQKMASTGITKYFKEVITSESAGFRKPEKEIFHYALKKVNCQSSNCLMIGDNLEADILGASNSYIDTVYFNPKKVKYHLSVTHEIECLSELKRIL